MLRRLKIGLKYVRNFQKLVFFVKMCYCYENFFQTVSNLKIEPCKMCGKVFESSLLQEHLKSHSDDSVFKVSFETAKKLTMISHVYD